MVAEKSFKNILTSSSQLFFDYVQRKVNAAEFKLTVWKDKYDKKQKTSHVTRCNSLIKYKPGIMAFASPELIGLLFHFAVGISSYVITNVLLKSYCLTLSNVTEAQCSGAIPKEIEEQIQPHVSSLLLFKTVIETLLPGLSILFVGPWSDSHGRRPVLLLSMLGFTVSYILWAVLSLQVNYLNPLYFLIASMPIGLTGGLTTFYLSIICSISDITTVQKRAFKMAEFEAALMIGIFVSQLVTAKVSMGPYGFVTTFSISAACCLLLLIYIYFLFPETVLCTQEIRQKGFVLDVFKAFFKSRSDHSRALLFLIIMANTAYLLIVFGESSVLYLNTQMRFSWQLEEYSKFACAALIFSGCALYFGTWFLTSILRLKDLSALLLISIPRIVSSFILAFITNWRYLYVGMAFSSIATLITPLYRSQISKLVPLHELGKIMAFAMFVESLIPISASALYTSVYNMTLTVFPGAVFLVSAGLSIICTTCIMIAYFLQCFYPSQDFSHLAEVLDDNNCEDQPVNKNSDE